MKAGEIFDDMWSSNWLSSTSTRGFTLSGEINDDSFFSSFSSCIYNVDYDESFGIWIDGDSCCGGAFDVGLISFFETADTGKLFDWQETVASFNIGIGTNVSIELQMSLVNDGLQWFKLCGKFSF